MANPLTFTSKEIVKNIKKYSFARQNKFRVEFNLPTKFVQSYLKARMPLYTEERFKLLKFNCNRLSTAERSLTFNDPINSAHEGRIMVAGAIKPPLSVSFICLSDMFEKYLFDIWLDYILDHQTRTALFLNEYSTEIIISQLDQKHQERYKITLSDAFPIQISPIQYDYNPSSMPVLFDTLFSFSSIKTEYVPLLDKSPQRGLTYA